MSPKIVNEQLGHASTAFTLDTYAHVFPHMQDEPGARVEVTHRVRMRNSAGFTKSRKRA